MLIFCNTTVRVTHVMRLGTQTALKVTRPRTGPVWTAQHRLHRAGQSDGASWRGGSGTPHLGHGEARPTTAGSLAMVASLLSFRAPPRITPHSARAAARGPAGGATLPAADSSSGSRANQPTMDGARGALLPIAAAFRLRATQARCGGRVMSWRGR